MENLNSKEDFLILGPRVCLADFFEEEIPNLERNIYHLLFPRTDKKKVFMGLQQRTKGRRELTQIWPYRISLPHDINTHLSLNFYLLRTKVVDSHLVINHSQSFKGSNHVICHQCKKFSLNFE